VASLAFGSKTELGYDPTLECVLINDTPQYKCTIDGVEYITVGTLWDNRSLRLVSRATRVWKVRRMDDTSSNPRYHALKDVWLDVGAKSEKEMQDDIFSRFNTVNPVNMNLDEARQYFMDIKSDQIVDLGDGTKDITWKLPNHTFMILEHPIDVKNQEAIRKVQKYRPTVGSGTQLRTGASIRAGMTRLYRPKKHHRILFRDVGEPLHHVLNHKKIFGALADTIQGTCLPECIVPKLYLHLNKV
jgi:hypothetical protein